METAVVGREIRFFPSIGSTNELQINGRKLSGVLVNELDPDTLHRMARRISS